MLSQKHMKSYSKVKLHSLKIKSAWSALWKAIQISLVQRWHTAKLARKDKFSFRIIDLFQSMIRVSEKYYHEDVCEAAFSHSHHTVLTTILFLSPFLDVVVNNSCNVSWPTSKLHHTVPQFNTIHQYTLIQSGQLSCLHLFCNMS
jgi:hypothetical protein